MQNMALSRRQLELRRKRREICPLRKEQFHEEFPGFAGLSFIGFHQ
jgi:hypothetical protein